MNDKARYVEAVKSLKKSISQDIMPASELINSVIPNLLDIIEHVAAQEVVVDSHSTLRQSVSMLENLHKEVKAAVLMWYKAHDPVTDYDEDDSNVEFRVDGDDLVVRYRHSGWNCGDRYAGSDRIPFVELEPEALEKAMAKRQAVRSAMAATVMKSRRDVAEIIIKRSNDSNARANRKCGTCEYASKDVCHYSCVRCDSKGSHWEPRNK